MKMEGFVIETRAESDARVGSLLFVVGVFLIAVMIVFATTDAVPIGIDEGEMPPNIKGDAHRFGAGEQWEDFDLYSLMMLNWTEGDYNATWYVIEFMSTDCPVCMDFAGDFEDLSKVWEGRVVFIAVAVDFRSNDEFTSTPEEIIAFQEKTDFMGCNHGSGNCNTREGGPHVNVLYVDDRDGSSMDDWDVSGTPTSFILKPNGVVAWNPSNHYGEELAQGLYSVVPKDGMGGGG